MKYKAIFFDRDGTLTRANPEKAAWKREKLLQWCGHVPEITYDRMMELFGIAAEGREPWYRDVADERAFYLRFYRALLAGEGVREQLDERAAELRAELWCNHERILYPEVNAVLAYAKRRGYRMGVISDTSPSLELTIRQLGIGDYFSSFTASSLVGVMKPDPKIYNAALASLGVTAEESVYVDDYEPEAEGARALGFTAFWLDRSAEKEEGTRINSLQSIVSFLERADPGDSGSVG